MAAVKEEHGDSVSIYFSFYFSFSVSNDKDGTDEIQREKYVLIKAEMKQRYRYFLFAHSFV